MLIYALGFTKKFHGTSPWEVFSMLYTGKIPDASYLAGWVIFVLILVGMCLKERFFCQYLCPMGAIFAWLPTLPFSVLDRDRSNCIPKCRACEIKCPVDYPVSYTHLLRWNLTFQRSIETVRSLMHTSKRKKTDNGKESMIR